MNAPDDGATTAARIRAGEIGALEAVDAALSRIEAGNGRLNAFVHLDPEGARAAARSVDCRIARGESVGALAGVPVAMKDLFDFKVGWPSTLGGLPQLKGNIAEQNCGFVESMEAADAVLVGKTNSPVFGFRGTTDNAAIGPTRNPFDTDRNAGGSSGGSAAAVAAGLLPLAEGTDGGGSARIPAAWTNTVGFKASAGRVPLLVRPNAFANTSPYIAEGTISRTVADARLGFAAMAHGHPGDPNAHPLAARDAPEVELRGLRVAYTPAWDLFPVEPEVRTTIDAAIERLVEAGAEVVEHRLGLPGTHGDLSDVWCRLMTPLLRQTLGMLRDGGLDLLDAAHRHALPPVMLHWIETVGTVYSADDLYTDLTLRTQVFDALEAAALSHDVVLAPTLCAMPVANATDGDTQGPSRIAGEAVDPLIGWCPTFLTNFSGHPSISLPAGLGASGLPVGLHAYGRRHEDERLLAFAAAYEAAFPWEAYYDRAA